MDTDLLHGEFVAAIRRVGGNAAYARLVGCSRAAVTQAIARRRPMPSGHVGRVAARLGEPYSLFRPDLFPPQEAAA